MTVCQYSERRKLTNHSKFTDFLHGLNNREILNYLLHHHHYYYCVCGSEQLCGISFLYKDPRDGTRVAKLP